MPPKQQDNREERIARLDAIVERLRHDRDRVAKHPEATDGNVQASGAKEPEEGACDR